MSRLQYFIGGPLDQTKKISTATGPITGFEAQFFESTISGTKQTTVNKPSKYVYFGGGPATNGKDTIEIYVDSTMVLDKA